MKKTLMHKMLKQLLIVLSFSLLLVGCQKAYVEIEIPNKNYTISANDIVADLIFKVLIKDGSYDNIIDKCSEISINFPYSIQLNEKVLHVHSTEDIENIWLHYYQYRDDIEINYPITISFSDYSEIILSDDDQLEDIQEQYNSSLIDDDIECVDFIYPIELSLFNEVKQSIDLIIANNDEEMHNVFANIDDLLVDISFPIELKYIDEQLVSISDNIHLEEEIKRAMDNCDEHDEVEFDDINYLYEDLLTTQEWVVSFYSDTTNETSSFNTYVFSFLPDNTVQVKTSTVVIYGVWELHFDEVTILELEFDTDNKPFVLLNAGWEIKDISSELIVMEAESDNDGYVKKLHLSVSE